LSGSQYRPPALPGVHDWVILFYSIYFRGTAGSKFKPRQSSEQAAAIADMIQGLSGEKREAIVKMITDMVSVLSYPDKDRDAT
jgi:hypothetical protein